MCLDLIITGTIAMRAYIRSESRWYSLKTRGMALAIPRHPVSSVPGVNSMMSRVFVGEEKDHRENKQTSSSTEIRAKQPLHVVLDSRKAR